jgi:hypothetical protein
MSEESLADRAGVAGWRVRAGLSDGSFRGVRAKFRSNFVSIEQAAYRTHK